MSKLIAEDKVMLAKNFGSGGGRCIHKMVRGRSKTTDILQQERVKNRYSSCIHTSLL